MIKVNEDYCEIKGKENEICAELGILFNGLVEEIGINKTKVIVNIALKEVVKENMKPERKQQIIRKKELKNKLRQDLPEEIAEVLIKLL